MSLSLKNNFIVGINKAWFEGQYDHDFGYNQFSLVRLYRKNLTDCALPDPNPDKPEISKNPSALDNFFSSFTIDHNLQVIRVWAFERFEGLQFDKNCNVVGIDDVFLKNIDNLFSIAKNHGVKIYLCLFDSWSLYDKTPKEIEKSGKTQEYVILQNAWKSIIRSIITNQQVRQKFLNNALRPLLERIVNNEQLFAIDLLNEPEGFISKDPQLRMANINNYISGCSEFIHHNYNSVKISCGFQKRSTVIDNIQDLAPNLDFLDFHEYNETGYLESYHPSDFAQKPCIIGEAGYPQHLGKNNSRKNLESAKNLIKSAHEKGYAGILTWIENYSNAHEILQATKDYAMTNPMYKNSKQTDPKTGTAKECFIATASMNSELSPEVQYLKEYRDFVLLKSKHEKIFKRIFEIYYTFSPPIARTIKKHHALQLLVRYTIVYPLVKSIRFSTKKKL